MSAYHCLQDSVWLVHHFLGHAEQSFAFTLPPPNGMSCIAFEGRCSDKHAAGIHDLCNSPSDASCCTNSVPQVLVVQYLVLQRQLQQADNLIGVQSGITTFICMQDISALHQAS